MPTIIPFTIRDIQASAQTAREATNCVFCPGGIPAGETGLRLRYDKGGIRFAVYFCLPCAGMAALVNALAGEGLVVNGGQPESIHITLAPAGV